MSFTIAPPQATGTLLLGAIVLGLVAMGVHLFLNQSQENWVAWTTRGAAVFLLGLAGLFGYFIWGAYHSTLTLDKQSLSLKVPIYATTIPTSAIDVEGARTLDLREDPGFKPSLRTNGLGAFGYQLGHFRLVNGKRATLALTTRSRVAYIPLNDRTALLVSVDHSDKLIQLLRDSV